MPPLLQLRDIRLGFGGAPLLQGADLSLSPGERLALVGRNGSGKSTLLKLGAGEMEADAGERFVQPNARLGYLPQEPDLAGFGGVLDYVLAGLGEADDPRRARALLGALDIDPAASPASLSGGQARRAALARTLASDPDILLLDEPTNHLDIRAIEWLEAELGQSRAALVVVSHDRRLLANLTRAVVWLDRGATRRLDQGFSAFEAWRDAALFDEEREGHKLDRRIAAEEDWLRYGVTARRKRNQRRVDELRALRAKRRVARRALGEAKMIASDAPLSGKLAIEAENAAKAYDEAKPVVADFSIRLLRGDRLAVVGPNGAGKTTLINLLTGALEPDRGSVRLGVNLAIASLDQRRASLEPTTTLVEALTGGGSDFVMVNGRRKHVVGYMRDFLFSADQARTPIGRLSGGERGRLMLARAFAQPSNLLALDEPTNDLDIETLDVLEDLLADYAGTVILSSHDRDFLDRVATSVLASEGDGRWIEYAGGYSDMIAQRGLPARPEEKTPKRAPRMETRSASSKRHLSFKEKHALEVLPARIETLRGELQKLDSALADPNFHARDPNGFADASQNYGAKQEELSRTEEEWLNLEILREEIEGSA
ncbi:MAG TPA: ATP-binding cassette domain-containing protein [Roseiarcus sp.]|nr:ATP-binding cassette domain-containing protein [Roseiarcus sp.]